MGERGHRTYPIRLLGGKDESERKARIGRQVCVRRRNIGEKPPLSPHKRKEGEKKGGK